MLFSVRSLLAFLVLPVTVWAADDRPNIVVVLCDDLGYGDLECYGHPEIKTPHLNKLAETGVRFTDFYSTAPVCSPSRVGLLTGRSPNRAGVYDWIPQAGKPKQDRRELVHMRASEITMAKLLKDAGYQTCMAGKWHCNSEFNNNKQPQPGEFGFDHWLATQNNASPSHQHPSNYVRNGEAVGLIEDFSCQIVVDETLDWLSKSDSDRPFFIYAAFHEPHEPIASPLELVESYASSARNENEAQYFANVANVDAAVGKLVAGLERLQRCDNTLIVFTSDNGPETLNRYRGAARSYGRPGPLRGMKLHTSDAGFRVAGIMNWKGRIQPAYRDRFGSCGQRSICCLRFVFLLMQSCLWMPCSMAPVSFPRWKESLSPGTNRCCGFTSMPLIRHGLPCVMASGKFSRDWMGVSYRKCQMSPARQHA